MLAYLLPDLKNSFFLLPTRFCYTGKLTFACQFSKTNSAHLKFGHITTRSSANFTTIVLLSLVPKFSVSLYNLRFFSHITPHYLLNGIPNFSSNAFASLSVAALVTIQIFKPETCSILSKSISGKIICSVMPTE